MREAIQLFFGAGNIFFIFYITCYASFLFLSVVVGSVTLNGAKRKSRMKNELESNYYLPVSILVPAYNEGITIEATIQSLLALDYRLYEIIVVDDGSTDDTARIVQEAFQMMPVTRPIQQRVKSRAALSVYETRAHKVPITLIRKENAGKADALNMGINASRYPYFLCMDADSVLQQDSLEKIVRPVLEDDRVVAVGGAVRPCNGVEIERGRVLSYGLPRNIIACMQALEYERAFLASRILLDQFNGSIIISGAFGLFRKSMVINAGGYDVTTVGEDMELVVRLHVYCRENRIPYRIRYATDAICWTQVPENLRDLCKQRRRWHIGLFQSLLRHLQVLANPKYGLFSFVSYLYCLVFELFSPYIEMLGLLLVLLAFLLQFLDGTFMVLFFLIYIVYSAILSLTAFFARVQTVDLKISPSDAVKALALCALEVSCLRFVTAWVRMTAPLRYNKGKQSWGQIQRKHIRFQ